MDFFLEEMIDHNVNDYPDNSSGGSGYIDDEDEDDDEEITSKKKSSDDDDEDLFGDVRSKAAGSAHSGDDEDDDEEEEKGKKSKDKDKSSSDMALDDELEEGRFNRENYYVYKDKLVQLSGTIIPTNRGPDGKPLNVDFKTLDRTYQVIMDDMGKKMLTFPYQEMLITGIVQKISEKEQKLSIKTYI